MTHRFLSCYIGVCAALVLIVQALSAVHGIMPGPLILCAMTVVAAALVQRRPRITVPRLHVSDMSLFIQPASLPFALALPLIAGISFALGWHMPPNNWDSMTYHLSRAAYWRQWHSLAHFPTHQWNQNSNPGNAEVLLLVTLLLTHTDTLAFLVQFSAYIAAMFAVYGIGRQIGLRPVYALVGAGMFATMPEVVLQSTSTQNDLLAAAFTACAAYFLFDTTQRRKPASLVMMGAALGLAFGTRPTILFALPGLGLGAAILLRHEYMHRMTRKGVATAMGAVLLLLALGAPWYIANKVDYGSFTGPRVVADIESVSAPPLTALRVNASRYLIGLLDPEGPVLVTRAASTICDRTATLRIAVAAALHVPATAQGTQAPGRQYDPMPACTFNEDLSWFGLAGVLAALATLAVILAPLTTRRIGPAWALASGVTSYLILFSLLIRWSPFQQRLLITMVTLAAPLLGLLAQRLWQWRLGRPLVQLAILYTALTGFVTATYNSAKPLGAWAADRTAQQTIYRPDMGPVLRHVAHSAPTSAQIGVILSEDNWDYPLFGPHLDRTVEPLVPSTPVTDYAIPPDRLSYVIAHRSAGEIHAIFRQLHLGSCRELWAVGVTDSPVPWTLYRCPRDNGTLLAEQERSDKTAAGGESHDRPSPR